MIYVWDEDKHRSNMAKHGVGFEEAMTVFDDDHAVVFYDEDHSDNEDRFVIVGNSRFGKVLVVVHCYQQENDIVRIISSRKSTKRERVFYEKGV